MIKKIIYFYIICQFFIPPIELKAIENDTIKIVSNIKMVPKVLGLLTKSARKKQKKEHQESSNT